MSGYRGIIFDLDGTLLNTLADLANAFNQALIDMGCPTHPKAAYKRIIGDGARIAAMRCLPHDRQDERSIEECVDRFKTLYESAWHEATEPYPGIPGLLAAIECDKGVLSNKDEAFTRACVAHYFEPDTFKAVIGFSDDVKHKPDPGGALLISEMFGCPPEAVIFVGDTATDMKTAQACNMLPIGVLWGFRDAQELTENGAEHLVETPKELKTLLEQLN